MVIRYWTNEDYPPSLCSGLQAADLKMINDHPRTGIINKIYHGYGLPRWLRGKKSACQCRRCKRCGFDPWVWKIPWRRAWQPTPVFLPGKSHGQRSLVGYSPWVVKSQTPLSNWAHVHNMAIRSTYISYNNFKQHKFSACQSAALGEKTEQYIMKVDIISHKLYV